MDRMIQSHAIICCRKDCDLRIPYEPKTFEEIESPDNKQTTIFWCRSGQVFQIDDHFPRIGDNHEITVNEQTKMKFTVIRVSLGEDRHIAYMVERNDDE